MKKIGLYFGSFNPIHIGHQIVANHCVSHGYIDEVWFIVSPQNPFKNIEDLAPADFRFELVNKALDENPHLKPSRVEFGLPLPSYSIQTIQHLKNEYQDVVFYMLMGDDLAFHFKQWKDWQKISSELSSILVYPRIGLKNEELSELLPTNFQMIQSPLIEISSTYVRKLMRQNIDYRYLVSDSVYALLKNSEYYTS